MSLIVEKGPSIPPLPDGYYTGICVWLVDCGEQQFMETKQYNNQVLIGFEICGESVDRGKGDEPRMISRTFTKSLGPRANLRAFLESWRGVDFTAEELERFDLSSLIGVGAKLNIEVDAKGRNKILSIKPPVQPVSEARMDYILYDIDDQKAAEELQKLPDWIVKMIKSSPSYAKAQANTDRVSMDDPKPTSKTEAMAVPF